MTRVIVSPLGDAHQRSAQAFADAGIHFESIMTRSDVAGQ